MPPRFAYWTIIAGGLPTAFRAADREDLLPTFHRLREKHPDAVMQWFARGRLWTSPEDARADLERQRSNRSSRPRSAREAHGGRRPGGAPGDRREPARGRDWRPGGEHRDPRQKYADAKKARNAARRRQRFEHKHGQTHEAQPRTRPPDARAHGRKPDARKPARPPQDSRGRRRFDQPAVARSRAGGTSAPRRPARPHGPAETDRERKRRRSETDG